MPERGWPEHGRCGAMRKEAWRAGAVIPGAHVLSASTRGHAEPTGGTSLCW